MKRILALFAALVLAALMFVSASAASVAKFNLNLVSETDTEAVISIDFEGGAGFACLDLEITPNSKKIEIVSIESGAGLDAFTAQVKSGFYETNKDTTPAKISMISLTPFRVVEGKDLFVVKLKKLSKDKLNSADLKVAVTNCADSNLTPITPSFTTDLQAEVTTTSAVSTAVLGKSDEAVSQSTTTQPSSASEEQILTNAVEPDSEALEMEESTTEAKESPDKSNTKTVIIIIVAVVFVGAIAAAAVVILKKKKPKNDEQ